MRVLMGIPAFRLSDLVKRSIDSTIGTPADVLVIDNGSDPSVKATLMQYNTSPSLRLAANAPERKNAVHEKQVKLIVNQKNTFCNGAWNQILDYGLKNGYDLIALNTDVALHGGWYDILLHRAANYEKEVWLPTIGPFSATQDSRFGSIVENIAGSCIFLTKEAAEIVYPIPEQLRQWFGDEYMFTKLRKCGWNTVVLRDLTGDHQWTRVTEATPEAYTQIEQDKIEWEKIKR